MGTVFSIARLGADQQRPVGIRGKGLCLFKPEDVTKFFEQVDCCGVHHSSRAEGVLAKEAGEAVGNFAFLPEGSVEEVVFLTCELIHHQSM